LLEEVERMASPTLVREARWYRALGLLRSEEPAARDAGRAGLDLIASSEGTHQREALALLDRLRTGEPP
jgi:hypothetical protein